MSLIIIIIITSGPRSTQPTDPFVGGRDEYWRKLRHNQAHRAM